MKYGNSEVEKEEKIDSFKKPNNFGKRHVQMIWMFFGMIFAYFLRVNISAAIVPMSKPSSRPDVKYYNWDSNARSLILSSFFWGYVVIQFPSGLLAKKYGAKNVLSVSTIICGLLTMLTPLVAQFGGWQLICGLRILNGLTQGVVYPCMHTLLAKWTPCTERGLLVTFVYSGAQLGTVIVLAISGVIFESILGWPGLFYITGSISIFWALAFHIFGSESPSTSKKISKEEKEYIEILTGGQSCTKDMPLPLKDIFTSLPVYALMASHCGFAFGFYFLLTQIPTYLDTILLLDVKSNAITSALPYLAMWMLGFVMSPISDVLINRKFLSVTAARKIFNSIGQLVPMVSLIALGYVTSENTTIAILLLTIAVGFNSATFVGYMVNHMDLSSNFAGTLMGLSNGVANIMSICAPLLVGAIVKNESNPAEWRIVFYITAGVYLFCNSLFVIFGSGKVQKWNEPKSDWTRKQKTKF